MTVIPSELLQIIFSIVDPICLGRLSIASKEFYSTIEDSFTIWRSQYLSLFDNPLPALALDLIYEKEETYNWKGVLKNRLRANTILRDILILKRNAEERTVFYETLLDIARTAHPNTIFSEESKNVDWLRRVYDHELVLHHNQWDPSPQELQLRSHFHVLLGLTNIDLLPEQRHISRSYVYDLSHYTYGSMYGPYLESDDPSFPVPIVAMQGGNGNNNNNHPVGAGDDVRVNWVHMRYVHHVFNFNYIERSIPQVSGFSASATSEDHKNWPMNIHHIRADSAPPNTPGIGFSVDKDWAGIEGRWQCRFCFCDHHDLIRFNMFLNYKRRSASDLPLGDDVTPVDPFLNPVFTEALRFIEVDFRVLALGKATESYPFPERPPIHFEGRLVIGGDDDEQPGLVQEVDAMIIGTVSMTREKQIRWCFTSGEQGHVVWSSEGIQVGGLRSSYGVLGCWTTVFHDEDDPAGPFWLRKKSGRVR